MTGLIMRSIHDRDLSGLARVYVAAFNAPPWNDGWSLESAEERLRRIVAAPHSLGVLAETDEGPLGFALGYIDQWIRS